MNNKTIPLKKKLWILREIETYREHRPKEIAKRHGISQHTIYSLWRRRNEIRSRA